MAFVISNLGLGGAQLLLYDIVTCLKQKANLDFTVISIDSGEYMKRFQDAGIKVIDLKMKGLVNFLIFFRLKSILKSLKPDIVHTHLLKADFYGRLASRYVNTPLILSTIHTHSTSHSLANKKTRSIYDILDDFSLNYSHAILIAVSNNVMDYLISRNKKLYGRISVIYNGINTDKASTKLDVDKQKEYKKKIGIEEGEFVISIIGRISESKGQMFFLKSATEYLRENKVKLLLAGTGDMEDEVKDYVAKNKLQKDVILLGMRNDVEEIIEISDLIAVPSLWEGFGLAIIEAMIKKKIVIASDVGGIPEIIEDSKSGFLFRSGDSDSLRKKLEYIYAHNSELDDVRAYAFESVCKKFDISKKAEMYYNLYIEKLNPNKS